jgi:hypothetical protein
MNLEILPNTSKNYKRLAREYPRLTRVCGYPFYSRIPTSYSRMRVSILLANNHVLLAYAGIHFTREYPRLTRVCGYPFYSRISTSYSRMRVSILLANTHVLLAHAGIHFTREYPRLTREYPRLTREYPRLTRACGYPLSSLEQSRIDTR